MQGAHSFSRDTTVPPTGVYVWLCVIVSPRKRLIFFLSRFFSNVCSWVSQCFCLCAKTPLYKVLKACNALCCEHSLLSLCFSPWKNLKCLKKIPPIEIENLWICAHAVSAQREFKGQVNSNRLIRNRMHRWGWEHADWLTAFNCANRRRCLFMRPSISSYSEAHVGLCRSISVFAHLKA